jgi:hypothetical protein
MQGDPNLIVQALKAQQLPRTSPFAAPPVAPGVIAPPDTGDDDVVPPNPGGVGAPAVVPTYVPPGVK